MIRFMDGINNQKYDEVHAWQNRLLVLGYSVAIDGMFGSVLHAETMRFQNDQLLVPDGVVGPATLAASARLLEVQKRLVAFRGSIEWLHRWESHKGHAYWPKGDSGVTIDPGVDLGYADLGIVFDVYAALLSPDVISDMRKVAGLRGEAARDALSDTNVPALCAWRISREAATWRLPLVAVPYWAGICSRFTVLLHSRTPGAVQTAFLSLAYNRGASNKALDILADSLYTKNWMKLGDLISDMQQKHKLQGIRERRRAEGLLIQEYSYV